MGRPGAATGNGGRAPAQAGAESALMARIAGHDLRAFETLYRLYHPRLTRFLLNMTRRPPLVDEVLNDTMLVVWHRPEGFDGTSKLSSWIFGIAYRKALKALQRQDMPVEDPTKPLCECPDAGPEQQLAHGQAALALRDAMAILSPEHRAVVDLTYFHDYGYREIADIMGSPVDTVKSRMFYARRHLARLLAGRLSDWW